jgi:hypothetical protein
MSNQIDIDFATFCDGPLNAKLSNDNTFELYNSYIERTNMNGHGEDYYQLQQWLEYGLDASTAICHIIEVFRKNHKTFSLHMGVFNQFCMVILPFNPDFNNIVNSIMNFDDSDDCYPTYIVEYTEDFSIRGYMIDYFHTLIIGYKGIIDYSVEQYIEELKNYGEWSIIPICTNRFEVDESNYLNKYLELLKGFSVVLQTLND